MDLVFKETSIFTTQVKALLSDDEYKSFQELLLGRPDVGPVIRDTGGCRKIRWAANNNGGKSGGIRVIYYWIKNDNQIFLLLAYEKSKQDNLTAKQKAVLKHLVKNELQTEES
ncbi:type II toxin-antitoxin system RelE/ParE family toxin [Marinobacterium sp. YM272]|uniref:type II toxin-antitoxin system RelE/ParE family toxin n=1 Tax=Marinobacterium sp. YM272 TaxID=3421654 RepID=UPI003D7FA0D6